MVLFPSFALSVSPSSFSLHFSYERSIQQTRRETIKPYQPHDATSVFIEFSIIKHSVTVVLLPSIFSFLLVCIFLFLSFLKRAQHFIDRRKDSRVIVSTTITTITKKLSVKIEFIFFFWCFTT